MLTCLVLFFALVQLGSTMPLFDGNGVQEDRGYISCSRECGFKKDKCMQCPELVMGENIDDAAIIKCANGCDKKYIDCIGMARTSSKPATGCHKPEISNLY